MEAHIHALFNACYDGIFLVDIDSHRLIEANEPGLALLGYTCEELRMLNVADLFPDELPRFFDSAEDIQSSGAHQGQELTCQTKSGELIPIQLLASALTLDDHPALLLMIHDMREHRLAQLGLAVSKIAHDLRGILATALLIADNLATRCNPECQRLTPRLIVAIDRAIGLCTDTLTYGRATQPPPSYSTCQLRPLVEDVANVSNVRETAGIVWHNEIAPDFKLVADPDQLFRALFNLVSNACKALKTKGGDIRISAAIADRKVVIDVTDTGPGVPPAVRARLFEPFANFGRPDSTGLGLAIAREFMRGHGGDVTLARSGSKGTVFRLELPEREES
tara:strand:- start:225 stop:1232 length:1008 start_codon:yes stop_codon:yes gene_type:complete